MQFKKWLEMESQIPFANVRVIGDVHNYINKPGPAGYSYMDLASKCNYSVQVGDMGGEHNGLYSLGVNAGGYNYSPLKQLDPKKHVFIGGNHDNYDALPAHHLGNFGEYQFPGTNFKFFYIRGAWSVNWRSARIMSAQDKRWWPQEEIDEADVEPAIAAYVKAKPQIVISHDIPTSVLTILKGSPDAGGGSLKTGVNDLNKRARYAQVSTKQTDRIKKQLTAQGITPPPDEAIPPYLTDVEAGQESRTNRVLRMALEQWRPKTWIFGHHHTDWGQMIQGTQFVGLGILSYMDF